MTQSPFLSAAVMALSLVVPLVLLQVLLAGVQHATAFTHAPPPWRSRVARAAPAHLRAEHENSVLLQPLHIAQLMQTQLQQLQQLSRMHLENWASSRRMQLPLQPPPQQRQPQGKQQGQGQQEGQGQQPHGQGQQEGQGQQPHGQGQQEGQGQQPRGKGQQEGQGQQPRGQGQQEGQGQQPRGQGQQEGQGQQTRGKGQQEGQGQQPRGQGQQEGQGQEQQGQINQQGQGQQPPPLPALPEGVSMSSQPGAVTTDEPRNSTASAQKERMPSSCVWAIVTCCQPQTTAVRYSCFELLSCPGAFWDGSPCEPTVTNAALREVSTFYGKEP